MTMLFSACDLVEVLAGLPIADYYAMLATLTALSYVSPSQSVAGARSARRFRRDWIVTLLSVFWGLEAARDAAARELSSSIQGCPSELGDEDWLDDALTSELPPFKARTSCPERIHLYLRCRNGVASITVNSGGMRQAGSCPTDTDVGAFRRVTVSSAKALILDLEHACSHKGNVGRPQPPRPFGPTEAYELRSRARGKRAGGIALLVLGSLNLAVALALGIPTGISNSRHSSDSDGDFVSLPASVTSGIVGAVLLSVGIPLFVGSQRDQARAANVLGTEGQTDLAAAAMDQAEAVRRRRVGARLLVAGGTSFGVAVLGWALVAGAFSLQSTGADNGGLFASGMALGTIGSVAGIVMTSIGGVYYRQGARASDAGGSKVTLRLQIGTTVGLMGQF